MGFHYVVYTCLHQATGPAMMPHGVDFSFLVFKQGSHINAVINWVNAVQFRGNAVVLILSFEEPPFVCCLILNCTVTRGSCDCPFRIRTCTDVIVSDTIVAVIKAHA